MTFTKYIPYIDYQIAPEYNEEDVEPEILKLYVQFLTDELKRHSLGTSLRISQRRITARFQVGEMKGELQPTENNL